MSGREDTIYNSVITARLNAERVDLDEVAASLGNVEFEPEKFMAVVVKRDTYVIILFHNGKITSSGKASIKEKKREIRKFAILLHNLGILSDARVKSFRVENIVSGIDVGRELDLERMAKENKDTHYNPEMFPSLTWNFDDCVVQVFGTGKAVMMGVRDERLLAECQDRILSLLEKYVIEGVESNG